jgi:hypothetical protein
MRRSFLLLALLAGSAFADPPPRQLLGLWHSIGTTTADTNRDITPPNGGWEREFRRDGTLIETVVSPRDAGDRPQRYRTHYTYSQPELITYTLVRGGQKVTKRQMVRVRDGILMCGDYENDIITVFRRISKSEFRLPPKDISDVR